MVTTKKFLSTLFSCVLALSFIISANIKVTAAENVNVLPFTSPLNYADSSNWLYDGIGDDKPVDVFIVAPSVDVKSEINSAITPGYKKSFRNAMNQQQALYAYTAKLYAPYYRQAALKAYEYDPITREKILANAYIDVSASFKYYLEHKNNGRPIILAGFSQGADMCYRLLQEYYGGDSERATSLRNNLVAVYAIGWNMTEDMVQKYPQIKPATGELDTGVVISYDCEDGNVTDSVITPKGTRALSINPLNWRTDSKVADKKLNKGSVTQDSSGAITSCTVGAYGAYIDPERGTLIVTGIDTNQYPAGLSIFPTGSLHLYDNFLFFVNLQDNIQKRTTAFLER
ncbi:Protein of unknown function [Butyrivibrio sp. ob235]|uniref:DUF3089 domain-containing protein n=1 Tax=unclassified Butyrivibrio TaxID=2639466 RepID=UPI0003B53811|nr:MULTISPECIES: DUF3089 domain-containing protein [unclassified Butyrivibrio]SEK48344.1 Protein of unknown function [Butyrivibrio sp. ob235]